VNAATLPWNLAFRWYGLLNYRIGLPGPILLALYLPPLLFLAWFLGRRRERPGSGFALVTATAYACYAVGFFGQWQFRWMLPAMAACTLIWMRTFLPFRWGPPVVVAALLYAGFPHLGMAIMPFRQFVASGFDHERFLASASVTEWYYPAHRALGAAVPAGWRACAFRESRAFYAHCRMDSGLHHDRSVLEDVLAQSNDVEGALSRLRARRISHLLYNTSVPADMDDQWFRTFTPRMRLLLAKLLRDGTRIIWRADDSPCLVFAFREPSSYVSQRSPLPRPEQAVGRQRLH